MEATFDFIASFLFTAIRIATPLIYVAICAVISQQAGLLNMAAESMMLASALAGVIFSAISQNLFIGILGGATCSVLVTLILCFATFVMKVDLYLMSIAMNTALTGGTIYVLFLTTGMKSNSAATFNSLQMPAIEIPIIKDIPFIGDVISGHNGFTYIAVLMVFLVWFLIFRTKLGLRIRAVGKNPMAAESVGINPRRIYTLSFAIAGFVASFGGMFLSMGYQTFFAREMTGGRGFIGTSASTIAGGQPVGAALVALIFGMADAITNILKLYVSDANLIAAMPYMITVVLLLVMSKIRMERQKRKELARAAKLEEYELEDKNDSTTGG